MTNTQIMTEASLSERRKTDDRLEALGLRYTPLRSHVITRLSRGTRSPLAHSPIVPAQRFRHSS